MTGRDKGGADADRLAAEIADGTPIDWQAAAAERAEELLDELKIVAAIADLHRAPLPGPAAETLTHWGHLTLLERLGAGTSGEVFLAVDDRLHRDVALKLLFPAPDQEGLEARALAEGRLMARIRHPNVVTVFAVEQFGGRIGLITERIRGRTLAEHVRVSGPLEVAECVETGVDVCGALAAVHDAGLLHRDIKAQNVMREEKGRTVLMDFGAGRAPDGSPALAGTPLYLAPELLEGAPATRASDIYSVGVLLHYLLTARFPVRGETIAEIRDAHRAGARTLLRHARPDLPRGLSNAIDTATDPTPANRHVTAEAFAADLARSRPARTRRRRALIGTAGVAAVLATAALVTALRPGAVPAAGEASDVASAVAMPPYYGFGGPSFDGRYLAYIDPQSKGWVVQTATGHSRRVLEAKEGEGTPHWFILSPDGRRGAYVWHLPDKRIELRVMDIDESWPQAVQNQWPHVVILATKAPTWLEPVDWSRDGSTLAVMVHRTDGGVELRVAASDGTWHRTLETFTGPRPRRVAFSADGRFVAYDLPNWPSPERDIVMVPVDGSARPHVVLGGPVSDEQPLWSADGRTLLFNSNREGSHNLWSVPVKDGVTIGAPRMIASGTQGVSPVRVTANGDYYYVLQTSYEKMFTVPLDARGVASGAPVPVPGDTGLSRTSAAWSPDGRTLAHVTIRGMNMYDFATYLTLRDAAGNITRDVALPLRYYGVMQMRWSPDGHSLLVRGKGIDGYWAHHRVDPATGAATAMVRGSEPGYEVGIGYAPAWGEDGRSLVWIDSDGNSNVIVERVLSTGEERTLVRLTPGEWVVGQAPAPRGRALAFTTSTGILSVVAEDGSVREVLRDPSARSLTMIDWSHDGRELIYAAVGGDNRARLWRVPAAGGAPTDMNVTIDRGRIRVSLRPDGQALTYSTGAWAFEAWVMRGIAR